MCPIRSSSRGFATVEDDASTISRLPVTTSGEKGSLIFPSKGKLKG
jgi:hypothetical protein